jgi:TetR/AcrR family transcriptional regulator, cholesterol catabolism regulator
MPDNAGASTGSITATPPADVAARLLAAALRLFGAKGYNGVSVREVARAADVTTPNVYYYFGSKRGLYLRLLHDLLERRSAAVRTALREPGDPITRLRRVLEAYIWFDRDDPVEREAQLFLLREIYGLGSDMFTDLVSEHDASNRRALRQVIEEGIRLGVFRPVRVEHTVIAIFGVMLTFIRRAALGARLRPSDGVTQVMDVMIEGLRNREATGASPASKPAARRNGATRPRAAGSAAQGIASDDEVQAMARPTEEPQR